MNKGAKKLAEISQSLFFDFTKKWQLQPGFKERWQNVLVVEKRDENIKMVLGEYDDFEILLDNLDVNTSKKNDNLDNLFDF